MSAYALEKCFHPLQVRCVDGKSVRPRLWDRYRDGVMIPKDKPSVDNLIDRVEEHVPFTAWWFRHVLWRVLQPKLLSQEEIDEMLFDFPDDIKAVLFDDLQAQFPKQKPFKQEIVAQLSNFRHLDSLAIAILMVRRSELIGSLELRDLVLSLYYAIQPALMQLNELELCFPDLFSYIDSQYPPWIYPSPSERMRVVVFSEGKFGYKQSYATTGKTLIKKPIDGFALHSGDCDLGK
ncbi:hypothetical protein [Agitococcus lubricus]|nr:hypothetical protein [Agitococcus lubricus]